MSTSFGKDKRKSPRRAFYRSVGILIKGEYLIVDALEIGEGGISIQASLDLQLEDQLVVSIFLPGVLGHAVARGQVKNLREPQLSGIVAGSGLPAFGIEFLNMPMTSRRAIRNYVAAKTEAEAFATDE